MFIVQPETNFGDLICEELISEEDGLRRWDTFAVAVAWINYAGAERIRVPARNFLARGGSIHATVGLDFGNTTYEGLASLLDLEDGLSDIATHVFCDESPACTFHPKIFLFSNALRARLFVGSNNMTGAGLRTNVEAALEFSSEANDNTILTAGQALRAWQNDPHNRSKRLTRELLDQLWEQKYVLTEEEIRDRRRSEVRSRSSRRQPLFGRGPASPQSRGRGTRRPGVREPRVSQSALGEVLLMRVRPRRNGKQVQISMKVLEAAFMRGAEEVVSIDGSRREIGYNRARGIPNTARFEAPEMMGMTNPVARFQWVYGEGPGQPQAAKVLQYEILDADVSEEGARIHRILEDGIATPPITKMAALSQEQTVLSKSDRASAQWYRLESI